MPDLYLPDDVGASFRFEILPDERPLNEDEFFEFCQSNSELRIERDADGKIAILPPAGGETGNRNSHLSAQLERWTRRDGRGRAFSNTGFVLPDGSMLSPGTAWGLKNRLDSLTKRQKQRFLPLCPDFVVELTSPTDRLSKVMAKMAGWMANGAQLGWLIDADRRTVYVYRPGQESQPLTGVDRISGEGPVEGFVLELSDIWQGL